MLTSLLRDVSRSFYLTLRVLPSAIRPQIGLAYLLARTSDTIADTELVPLEQRLAALRGLRSRIVNADSTALDFGSLATQQGSPAEQTLLLKCETSLALLGELGVADRKLVAQVLEIIIGGQELDLRRFSGASADHIKFLASSNELDDYTYRVAGCVGEFWTRMCLAHVFPSAGLNGEFLLTNGVRFGKGLQLVNILRDLAVDVRHGRCYLPSYELQAVGLAPADLLLPAAESKVRPLYNSYLDKAGSHLKAGWTYTNALPWTSMRVRLACAWPLLIGQRTLELLRAGRILDPNQRLKVTRSQVKTMMLQSVLFYPWPARWKRLFGAACNDY
jgi:farnesyl-diphosphate farnesyltransferase